MESKQKQRLARIYRLINLVIDNCKHGASKKSTCIFSVLDHASINLICESISNLINHSEQLSCNVRKRIKRQLSKGTNKEKCLDLANSGISVSKRRKILMRQNQTGKGQYNVFHLYQYRRGAVSRTKT